MLSRRRRKRLYRAALDAYREGLVTQAQEAACSRAGAPPYGMGEEKVAWYAGYRPQQLDPEPVQAELAA